MHQIYIFRTKLSMWMSARISFRVRVGEGRVSGHYPDTSGGLVDNDYGVLVVDDGRFTMMGVIVPVSLISFPINIMVPFIMIIYGLIL